VHLSDRVEQRHEGAPCVDRIVAEQRVVEPVARPEVFHDEKA